MLFLQLFLTFLKIGVFTFGGGYAMVALIQNEVVVNHAWISAAEFTDILAVSQMTPGPIGINTATYVGYTAVLNAGYSPFFAVLGSFLASFAIVLLPMILILCVTRWLLRNKDNADVKNVLSVLKIVVIGLIAASALSLLNHESFGCFGWNRRFVVSVLLFVFVFLLSLINNNISFSFFGKSFVLKKPSPFLLLFICAVVGLLVYM